MSNTKWFHDCGWGVMCHYLGDKDQSADDWNRQVDAFDVDGLAEQLASAQVPYFLFTVGQNSGHYCAPNSAYDSFTGITPSKCSRRDLIMDLHTALERHGIPLMVYLPSNAPSADSAALKKLEWEWGCREAWPKYTEDPAGRDEKRLASFQKKWEAVIREWSMRWGSKVRGWWIDGCYFANIMYRCADEPNFKSFAAALRSGNPDSILAFNPDVRYPVTTHAECEDFTAGEVNDFLPICPGRYLTRGDVKIQWHMLTFLGRRWGVGEPRFNDALVVGFTSDVIRRGGVITWDARIQKNGLLPDSFIRQLRVIGNSVKDAPVRDN